jgi:hypothetical protein
MYDHVLVRPHAHGHAVLNLAARSLVFGLVLCRPHGIGIVLVVTAGTAVSLATSIGNITRRAWRRGPLHLENWRVCL